MARRDLVYFCLRAGLVEALAGQATAAVPSRRSAGGPRPGRQAGVVPDPARAGHQDPGDPVHLEPLPPRGRRCRRGIEIMKGTFITFEGIEGSGKSTQIVLLANYLKAHTRTGDAHPGAGRNRHRRPGEQDPARSRQQLCWYLRPSSCSMPPPGRSTLKSLSGPSSRPGRIVLCDRFSDATLAYQGYGRGSGPGDDHRPSTGS